MQYVYSFVGSALVLFLSAAPALAQNGANPDDSDGSSQVETGGQSCGDDSGSAFLCNPLPGINSIPAFFQAILDIVMVLAIPFIVFFIIYAGFLYVIAQGKPEQIAKAHSALLYALIGGVLILAANVLLAVVTGTVNEFTG